ncbi:MAG: hypothetical protein ACOC41_00285 [Chitinivibrionales bacterium]
MKEYWMPALLGGAAVVLIVYSLTTIGMHVVTITHENNTALSEDMVGLQNDTIKQALSEIDMVEPFELTADMRSPFKSTHYRPRRKKIVSRGPAYKREPLRLKGILTKDNSLAIIENGRGKTFICRKGDTIGEQEVYEIGSEEVVMRDKLGTYRIAVSQK